MELADYVLSFKYIPNGNLSMIQTTTLGGRFKKISVTMSAQMNVLDGVALVTGAGAQQNCAHLIVKDNN